MVARRGASCAVGGGKGGPRRLVVTTQARHGRSLPRLFEAQDQSRRANGKGASTSSSVSGGTGRSGAAGLSSPGTSSSRAKRKNGFSRPAKAPPPGRSKAYPETRVTSSDDSGKDVVLSPPAAEAEEAEATEAGALLEAGQDQVSLRRPTATGTSLPHLPSSEPASRGAAGEAGRDAPSAGSAPGAIASPHSMADAAPAVPVAPTAPDPTNSFDFKIPYQCDKAVQGLTVEELCRSSAVYNVELSWLAFNWRVLSMACSERVPLLEKLMYLGISASNLDEFFAKRVGGLKRQLEARKADKLKEETDKLIWSPDYQLKLIAENVKQLVTQQTAILYEHIEPALSEANIRILRRFDDLGARERERLRTFFTEELELLLTPIALDPGHPFPFLQSLSIGIAVRLQDTQGSANASPNASNGNDTDCISYAVVSIPPTVDRWIKVETGTKKERLYLPVEQLIISHLDQLFGGWKIIDAWTYRVTRNAELERHEDEAEDLLEMIAEEVRERMFAPFVRLEVQSGTPSQLVDLLTEELELNRGRDVYQIDSLLDLQALKEFNVSAGPKLSKYQFPKHVPVPMNGMPYPFKSNGSFAEAGGDAGSGESIFDAIARKDFLVHHPYESFESSTLRFLQEASVDPDVLAIKATVYRTSNDSPVIEALLRAAERRKHVAVLMELKARFDEARNISYAEELEAAGCSVAYGLIGLKTHCKVMLVVRKEKGSGLPSGLRTYVHIGTGNYNPVTAGLYSDFSLFSCDPLLGRDVMDVFKHLTGLHRQNAVGGYRKLLVAQVFMRRQFVEMIDAEIAHAREGRHAAILLKVNGLDDRELVSKLYEASQANVRVDCIVRGVCRLRPGVKGVSENIRVISVLGRYLEHHRVAVFHNAGEPRYFIGSADWMTRNLSRRVEVATPVEAGEIRRDLCDILSCYLSDRKDAWELLPDGTYAQPALRWQEAVQNACLVPGEALRRETRHLMHRSSELGTQAALIEWYQRDKN